MKRKDANYLADRIVESYRDLKSLHEKLAFSAETYLANEHPDSFAQIKAEASGRSPIEYLLEQTAKGKAEMLRKVVEKERQDSEFAEEFSKELNDALRGICFEERRRNRGLPGREINDPSD